jgi:hypothetical protein
MQEAIRAVHGEQGIEVVSRPGQVPGIAGASEAGEMEAGQPATRERIGAATGSEPPIEEADAVILEGLG